MVYSCLYIYHLLKRVLSNLPYQLEGIRHAEPARSHHCCKRLKSATEGRPSIGSSNLKPKVASETSVKLLFPNVIKKSNCSTGMESWNQQVHYILYFHVFSGKIIQAPPLPVQQGSTPLLQEFLSQSLEILIPCLGPKL